MFSIIKKFNKKVVIVIVVIAILLVSGIWLLFNMTKPILGRDLPVSYASAEYAFDVTDPRAMAGEMDYIFVGQIVDVTGTDYRYASNVPVTNYDVRVLKNIKGELITDTIKLQKIGGLSIDQTEYILREDDFLPEPGKIYIFNAMSYENGIPQLSSKNSNILLDVSPGEAVEGQDIDIASLLEQIEVTEEYHTYTEALNNPIKTTSLERQLSMYDVANYGIADVAQE
jgi:hypothetical protein